MFIIFTDSMQEWRSKRNLLVALFIFQFITMAFYYLYHDTFNNPLRTSIAKAQDTASYYRDNFAETLDLLVKTQNKEVTYSKFRKHYNRWEKDNPYMTDFPAQNGTNGYFIYECRDFCCGWADQLKGTMFAYMVANLTGRIFKARYLKTPCEMRDYLIPNQIDWFLDRNFTAPPNTSSELDNHIGDWKLKANIAEVNFTEYFELEKKYHFFIANLQYFSQLNYTTVYKKELSWMKNITTADAYGAVYKRLFKLSPRLESKLQNILNKALPTEKHRLICVHVRVGKTGFTGDPARNHVENMPRVWAWMKQQIRSDLDKIFVMSDSHKVIESAMNETFRDRLITVPGAIVHTNKYTRDNITDPRVVCDGFERLLLEYHILMNCDILVRGHSGISVIASNARGTDEGNYCLTYEGNVLPCLRNKFWPEFL